MGTHGAHVCTACASRFPNLTSADKADPAPAEVARRKVSEDWIATVVGLVLMLLAIAGVITKAMIP